MQENATSGLAGGDVGVRLRRSVQESWARSKSYGIDPRRVRKQTLDRATLVPFQERARSLLEAADPVIAPVHSALRNEAHMIAVSDADGVVVRFMASGADGEVTNFFEGASWSERDIGTNGIGTALAAGTPVLVAGPQHFVQEYHPWACVGVPVRSPDGHLLGALNLSVPSERMNEHTWGWTFSLVSFIEAELHRRRLEDWDRRKDGALATLSHELKNPLQTMGMSVELLGTAQRNPGRLDAVAGRLRHGVKRLATVVDDIGDVARVKRGGLVLHKQIVDLNEVVNHAADAVQPQMEGLGHELVRLLAPHQLTVDGDPQRLEQVFTNILSNAAKYTPPGGHIVVDSRSTDGEARVCVRDDGYGISPEDLSRIFGEFSRVVRAKNDPGGLGIGLALVKSLVEHHGGSVTPRSDGPGKGSEFEVALPLTRERSSKARPL